MMANLFSSFDPATNMNLSLNWVSSLMGLIIMPSLFWLIPSRHTMMWKIISHSLHKEFKTLLQIKNSLGASMIFIALFTFILSNNFLGLFPYIFTSTSHLSMSIALSIPLWISFMMYGWTMNASHMFAHLVPQGTPNILMPFMVIIETISNLIRPGTLAVRLSANMIAGHLLMTLLGNTGPNMSTLLIPILLIIQIALLILETAVAIIQSYVFSVLSTLYSSEV